MKKLIIFLTAAAALGATSAAQAAHGPGLLSGRISVGISAGIGIGPAIHPPAFRLPVPVISVRPPVVYRHAPVVVVAPPPVVYRGRPHAHARARFHHPPVVRYSHRPAPGHRHSHYQPRCHHPGPCH